ncbi:hypothetical protein [Spongorhabdus nitratireducens]
MQQTAIEGNKCALEDLKTVLELIDNETYAGAVANFQGTPGMHTRHILQHYENLLEGIQQGHVCYDKRSRKNQLEQDREFALATLKQHLAGLESIKDSCIIKPPLTLQVRVHGDSEDDGVELSTTLIRELLFLQSHTVHHLALLRVMLVQQGYTVPEETGMAPATLHYQKQEEELLQA